MAARLPARRRSAKPAKHRPRPKQSLAGRTARTAYIIVGTVGLAALAAAILGPRRLEREVLEPLQQAVGPKAEKLWQQARPVRAQLTRLFRRAGDEREKLAHDFQSWIGRFRAF